MLFEWAFETESLVAMGAFVLRSLVFVLHVSRKRAGMKHLVAFNASHAVVGQVVVTAELNPNEKE